MKAVTKSVKVDEKILNKVRKAVKKTKQSIGGFYDLAAISELERIKQQEEKPKP